VVVARGEIWWAELAAPSGAAPGFRRPVLVVQSDAFNRSRIGTIVAVVLTSSIRLLDAPGNVLLARNVSGLQKDSVANVSQLVTLDRTDLQERVGRAPRAAMRRVDDGLRLVLGLMDSAV
jgi:mRNA interferase MazF